MTPTLRKYHRNIWPIFAIILIGFFVMAYQVMPEKEPESNANSGLALSVSIPKDFVEIELSGDFSMPSLLFYASENEGDSIGNDKLLGQINSTGKFQFSLDSTILKYPIIYFKGYDPIHNQIILKAIVE